MKKEIIAFLIVILVLFGSCATGKGAAVEAKEMQATVILEKPDSSVQPVPQAVLRSDVLKGTVLDNVANANRQGSGFNPLEFRDLPGFSFFKDGAVGLNYEHVFNGAAADKKLAMFTPRQDHMELYPIDSRSALMYWPAEESSWGMECALEYSLDSEKTAVDMVFNVTPMDDRYPQGWAAMMWASYMNGAADRKIHFYGSANGQRGWQTFGEDMGTWIEMGTVGYDGAQPLPYEEGSDTLNVMENPVKRFVKPFYYGLMKESHPDDPEVPMAFVMMFDQAESIRFAMWNFYQDADGNPDTSSPAWDWHYVIQNPQPGVTYGYRARMMVMPYYGPESVEAEYNSWRESLD